MSNRQFTDTQDIYTERNLPERRARRIQEMKKRKARQIMLRKISKIALPLLAIVLIITVIVAVIPASSAAQDRPGSKTEQEGQAGQIIAGAAGSVSEQNSNNGQNDTNAPSSTDQQNDTSGQGNVDGQENDSPQNGGSQNDTGGQINSDGQNSSSGGENTSSPDDTSQNTATTYAANTTSNTLQLSNEIISTNALFIDLESDNILAQKAMNTVISPASMTKVLTILVAAEQIQASQLDDTFTMTLEITDYGYVNDCSSAGFLDGEEITVRDLFYGTILPSGADAAVGLAVYTAGSHEAFVELMNEKIEELGLSETAHMTNCVGLYDTDHHCTVYDMAMIMEAALENDICREVMTAHTYTTSITDKHPEGILLSNWFLRRIEDKDTGGEVICAKTGYVAQSGSCAVSYGVDNAGNEYVCVTANSTSSWKCIYDHVALYKKFAVED